MMKKTCYSTSWCKVCKGFTLDKDISIIHHNCNTFFKARCMLCGLIKNYDLTTKQASFFYLKQTINNFYRWIFQKK